MKKKYGEFIAKLALVTVCAFLVIDFPAVHTFIERLFAVLQPVVIGGVLALAMCVPLRFFKYKIFRKIKNEKAKEILSLATTFLLFAGVIALLAALILPQGADSVRELMERFSSGAEETFDDLPFFSSLKPYLLRAYSFLSGKITEYVPQILSLLQNVFTGLYNVLFGIVIAVMLVIHRKNVKLFLRKIIDLLFKEKNAKIRSVLLGATEKFSRYLGGQLTEACILGFVCYIVMLLLHIPFAALVSLIVGFMNLIPILGAYIAGVLCAILVFSADPSKALVFLAALLILQQVEGFTTYPVIVGKYVGLNGFWTTVSVIVFGGLFGFWGMFFGVPVTAFAFELFESYYNKKKAESVCLSLEKQTFPKKGEG